MEFKDHQYPNETLIYPPSEDVLKYLKSYANRFNLEKYIKFNHLVIRVQPIENEKWEIIVKDQPNNKYETKIYDAVFVCNGHFSTPLWPEIGDANTFKGKTIHSHDFRTVDPYRGKKKFVFVFFASYLLLNQLIKFK